MKKVLLWGGSVLAVAGVFVFMSLLLQKESGGALGARFNVSERTVLEPTVATSTGSIISVKDYQFMNWTVVTEATTGTIRFACSMSGTPPVFDNAASSTNRYDFIDVIDLEDEASVDGDTGLLLTGTTDVRQFQMRNANYSYCTVVQSPWSAGSSTVYMLPATNF